MMIADIGTYQRQLTRRTRTYAFRKKGASKIETERKGRLMGTEKMPSLFRFELGEGCPKVARHRD